MATLSVGLFASSLSSNQIVAAAVAMGLLLTLSVIDLASSYLSDTFTTIVLQISITSHFEDFTKGIIDTHNVVYYIILTAFLLFLTIRSLESRRWR